eukprot:3854176-Heterocapsa_arctica.AAC.1
MVEIMTFRRPQGLAVPIEDGAWRSLADEKNVHDVMLVGVFHLQSQGAGEDHGVQRQGAVPVHLPQ